MIRPGAGDGAYLGVPSENAVRLFCGRRVARYRWAAAVLRLNVFPVLAAGTGYARAGVEYLLQGSAGYAFLAAQPRDATAFASTREGDALRLWHGPISGGLIWSEPGLLARIARAQVDPRAALNAQDARERLAGVYYLAVAGVGAGGGKPTSAEFDVMVDGIAWGMSHGSPSTHQAAVDALEALGYPLEALGIAYHPLFRPALKQEAATKLRAWWARQR